MVYFFRFLFIDRNKCFGSAGTLVVNEEGNVVRLKNFRYCNQFVHRVVAFPFPFLQWSLNFCYVCVSFWFVLILGWYIALHLRFLCSTCETGWIAFVFQDEIVYAILRTEKLFNMSTKENYLWEWCTSLLYKTRILRG